MWVFIRTISICSFEVVKIPFFFFSLSSLAFGSFDRTLSSLMVSEILCSPSNGKFFDRIIIANSPKIEVLKHATRSEINHLENYVLWIKLRILTTRQKMNIGTYFVWGYNFWFSCSWFQKDCPPKNFTTHRPHHVLKFSVHSYLRWIVVKDRLDLGWSCTT